MFTASGEKPLKPDFVFNERMAWGPPASINRVLPVASRVNRRHSLRVALRVSGSIGADSRRTQYLRHLCEFSSVILQGAALPSS